MILILKTAMLAKKVVENLHMVPKRKLNVTHYLYWGRENLVQMCNVSDIIIFDTKDSFICKAEVFSKNKITGLVPKIFGVEA